MLLMGTEEEKALEIAKRIIEKVRVNFMGEKEMTLSFGVATLNSEQSHVKKVISDAEDMLGRNKMFIEGSIQNSMIVSMQRAILERDLETEEHTKRMASLVARFANFIGLERNEIETLQLLATLHDIGKIGIPDKILLKKGSLTKKEWETMKRHSEMGHHIVTAVKTLSHIGEYILHHHEKWDGTGYPDGIEGEEIPMLCRILSIVDAYDVMTHERPYKKAFTKDDAIAEIERCSGTQFDPEIAEKFVLFIISND
jgi:HD-GYP domain-containing protein (c-di-GMP phosphodiesterase class II)